MKVKKRMLAKGGGVVKGAVLGKIAGLFPWSGAVFKDYMGRVHEPGTLAKSIAAVPRVSRTTGEPWLFVRARSGKNEKYDAYYAFWLERGTSKMGARPFMRPALEQSAGAAMEAAAVVGQGEIEAICRQTF
jgi:HK97 gp10 family phage protein